MMDQIKTFRKWSIKVKPKEKDGLKDLLKEKMKIDEI